jgi:phosphoribosylaminoimidazole-succinocarboxamide synthase
MDSSKIWSAEELEKMSPNERQSVVRSGFETDLSKVPPELLERTRRKIEAHIAANQDAATPER